MQLDHLFAFVADETAALHEVSRLGLRETYRRLHPGQGTANVCCAFDDAYLEWLWLHDEGEARAPAIAPSGLLERSRWRTEGTCPFGIAWRGDAPQGLVTWPYRPPYLPAGMDIPIAQASRDPRQPLLFRSPGASPPLDWPDERRGRLQHEVGLGALARVEITTPVVIAEPIAACCAAMGITFVPGAAWSLQLWVRALGGPGLVALDPWPRRAP
jgi:hypothetical protein